MRTQEIFNIGCDVIDVIRSLQAETGATEEQATRAVEIAILTEIAQSLNCIDDSISSI